MQTMLHRFVKAIGISGMTAMAGSAFWTTMAKADSSSGSKDGKKNASVKPNDVLSITVLGARWCSYSRKFEKELVDAGYENVKFLWVDEDPEAKPPNPSLEPPRGFPTSYICNLAQSRCAVLPGYVDSEKFDSILKGVAEAVVAMDEKEAAAESSG